MATDDLAAGETWAPASCTLPTVERPLRTAEFDELFATAVQHLTRAEPERLELDLRPDSAVAARAADLMARETGCCGFFTFVLVARAGELRLEVTVSDAHVDVLDAIAERAAAVAVPAGS